VEIRFMKQHRRFRPALEMLEHRACPALNVAFSAGVLTLSGTPPTGSALGDGLYISMPSPGVVRVQELFPAAVTLGNFANVRTLTLNLTSYDTDIAFDLNGNTFTGAVNFNLGKGDSDISTFNTVDIYSGVAGGRITGAVAISGGSGSESFNIGQDPTETLAPVTISGNLTVTAARAGSGFFGDSLTLAPGSAVLGNVTTTYVDAVFAGFFGSTTGMIGGSLTVNDSGSPFGLDAEVFGSVLGNFSVTGTSAVGGGLGDVVAVNAGGTVGGNVTANLGDGANLFILDSFLGTPGVVGGSLSVSMGNGPDSGPIFANEVDLLGMVGKSVTLTMGNGDSTVYFDAGAVVGGNFNYTGGNGFNDLDGVNSLFAGSSFDGTIGGSLSVRVGNSFNNMTFNGVVNGPTFSYTAGTGSNTLTINGTNTFALTVTLAGGSTATNSVAFAAGASVGSAVIDFGVAGTKLWTPPTVSFPITLRHFP
jgi:hypothetical protein